MTSRYACFALLLCAGCGQSALGSNRAAPQAAATSAVPIVEPAEYPYSALYRRVDRSFSSILIDTPFGAVKRGLGEVREHGCEGAGDCSWTDRDGVEHYFWADGNDYTNRDADLAVIKTVESAKFNGRLIGALGIGLARTKADVLAKVRRFLPDVTIECDPPDENGEMGYEECDGSVDPGWFRIGFDKQGKLTQIRFDGYHFT